jgi:hypothetical protein
LPVILGRGKPFVACDVTEITGVIRFPRAQPQY